MYRVLIRVDCICFCIVQYCKGMPITSSALGAMPPSSIQTFVNYSYCIDHLLKEINVTLNLNLNRTMTYSLLFIPIMHSTSILGQRTMTTLNAPEAMANLARISPKPIQSIAFSLVVVHFLWLYNKTLLFEETYRIKHGCFFLFFFNRNSWQTSLLRFYKTFIGKMGSQKAWWFQYL